MKVRAIESSIAGLPDGTTVNVTKGEEHDREDPVVKAHPWLFERDNAAK